MAWFSKKKKKLPNIKCVFWFALQLLSEVFLTLRTIQRHIIINVRRCSCKVPSFLSDSKETWIFSIDWKKYSYIKFHENLSSRNRVVLLFRLTDKHTIMTKPILAFRNFKNARYKDSGIGLQPFVVCVVTLLPDLSRALRYTHYTLVEVMYFIG